MSTLIPAPNRVLPTLNADGSRRRVRPELYRGRFWRGRAIVAWMLIGAFAALPFVRVGGLPPILLDVPARRFVLLGRTFLPTDGVLLMLLLLCIFVGVIWLTALLGRAWCGWGCPQTVYMEFVFRPIERLFEGGRNQQLRLDRKGLSARRVAKYVVFALLSVLVGNLFLAYFVGTDRLLSWTTRSPAEHPAAFLVMATTAGLVMLDFAWFREQMCTVICPYARLQSVLLDRRSLVVGYDARRGEPRVKGKPRAGAGDCIDCDACVRACPTGIDIREGLQLECIACTQCMDACDSVMQRIEKPNGLIRYGSQDELETGEKSRLLRPRVLVYPAIFVVLLTLLLVVGKRRAEDEITLLRGTGAPYAMQGELVQNQIRVKIRNRSSSPQRYAIALDTLPGAQLIAPENPLLVAGNAQRETSVFVLVPKASFTNGLREVSFSIRAEGKAPRPASYRLVGPKGAP